MKNSICLSLFILCSQICFSQKNGPYEKHFDNGQLKISGQYKSKKRVGDWKAYYDTGEIHKTYSYTKGKRNSDYKSFFKNGTLKSETKKVGDQVFFNEYYESGKLLKERILKNGYYKEYFENGQLKVESNYEEGELSGVWERFFETGEKEWKVNYYNGYKHGLYEQYYKNGQLKVEGNHENDKKGGKENRYSKNGQIEWEGFYTQGVFDKQWREFDSTEMVIRILKFNRGEFLDNEKQSDLVDIEVPDGVLERVPVYPGCENELGNKAQKKCMSEKISQFVMFNFNKQLARNLGLSGNQKISVIFKIDKTGHVIDIRARAPHFILKKEAIRVIGMLPKMKPGSQLGKTVIVPYSLPIIFQVQSKKKNEIDFVRDF